jgi:hypothetical protein
VTEGPSFHSSTPHRAFGHNASGAAKARADIYIALRLLQPPGGTGRERASGIAATSRGGETTGGPSSQLLLLAQDHVNGAADDRGPLLAPNDPGLPGLPDHKGACFWLGIVWPTSLTEETPDLLQASVILESPAAAGFAYRTGDILGCAQLAAG